MWLVVIITQHSFFSTYMGSGSHGSRKMGHKKFAFLGVVEIPEAFPGTDEICNPLVSSGLLWTGYPPQGGDLKSEIEPWPLCPSDWLVAHSFIRMVLACKLYQIVLTLPVNCIPLDEGILCLTGQLTSRTLCIGCVSSQHWKLLSSLHCAPQQLSATQVLVQTCV